MATLLELCTEAIEGIDSFNVPSSIIGNDDPTAVLLKSAATKVGRELIRQASWQALEVDYSFSTVASISAYSLPSDIQRYSSFTFWNESERRPLRGPASAITWAAMTRGLYVAVINYGVRVSGNYMRLSPTPTSAQTIGYDYYSRYFCTTAVGAAIPNWTADSNLWRLDPDLLVLGIQYHFRADKGLPAAKQQADYQAAIASLQYDDTPKALSNLCGTQRGSYDGLPEGSFGGSGGGSGDDLLDDDGSPLTDD